MKPSPFATAAKPTLVSDEPDASTVHNASKPADLQLTTTQKFVPAPVGTSPFARVKEDKPILMDTVITDADIEGLGAGVTNELRDVLDRIIGKMKLSAFGELGTMLVKVELEAQKLDPTKLKHSGVLGWIKDAMMDIREELKTRFETASKAFDDLETTMKNQIGIHNTWILDMDTLYTSNFKVYGDIKEAISKGESWYKNLDQQIKNWPAISPDDPDAFMKAQNKQDAKDRLDLLGRKNDWLKRQKAIVEMNAPRIRDQQKTSRGVINVLRDTIEALPYIKLEFAKQLQSLDSLKDVARGERGKELLNQSLTKSADSAHDAAIAANKSLNSPMVTNQTIDHLRTKMLETIQGVREIQDQARAQREADATAMAAGQKECLTKLQAEGAI